MKKSQLRQIIKEEIKKLLKEDNEKYLGSFELEHGSDSAAEWKRYIQNIPGVKCKVYSGHYKHHTHIDIYVPNKQTAAQVIKALRQYNINWPEVGDFNKI